LKSVILHLYDGPQKSLKIPKG